ncbi:hypothetical protein CKF48_14215 [Cytobacillus kochii]|uniref:3-isopropylmalate dehydrogenase n=1 Tax=Cytobacillus kochii TaxID=859143 RepID=A0A248TJW6_9BACI|nr:hypothetical protein CKF48_14215 [Cytobacillus kochii]
MVILSILMIVFIAIANIAGAFVVFKKRSVYKGALIILAFAPVFGGMGSLIAISIIRDPFTVFYGLQIGYMLLVNSGIVLFIAVIVSCLQKVLKMM